MPMILYKATQYIILKLVKQLLKINNDTNLSTSTNKTNRNLKQIVEADTQWVQIAKILLINLITYVYGLQ